ncbi:rRNA N6-adenosine-methyltransferase ZCCHC4 [Galleria mellonella]|uniref:rRNA N6-adenosine-methyltransferase ZCCHC4 n=1 Tax=Galleria mellonella TaxID=7137 RepID=A0A6J1WYY6_GALME|nr:rRNA N6-adenosine-methyltransferase ZCCHC4 [Galleria mellonella]
MGKKRKLETNTFTHKQTSVEVIIKDVNAHPLCLHGPTLLFSSEKGRYYACACCRNKECTVHIEEKDWEKEGVRKRNEKYYNLIPKIDKDASWRNFNEVKSRHASDRAYCNTCQELYIVSQSRKHTKDHRVITPLIDEQLAQPSSWLPTLENDSVEAQYMFTKKSVGTILGILRNNNVKNILCIGTPSVHEAAQMSSEFNSILLDYDTRHHLFHAPYKYIWYNMFNNYMFNGNNDEKVLKKFFNSSKNGGICVVMDPPFGGRVEPLVHTLRELTAIYKETCKKEDSLPILWAFPYFAEPYIRNMMPEIKMHDYQIEYEKHKKFQSKTKSGRKFGSPVRFFTNLPLATIDLSNDSNYKFCDKCKYWVAATNNHCNKCKECTSKNGMTYKHCNTCKRCVKPTFFHCTECNRCCQQKDHICGIAVESQSCYNCHEKGHKQSACPRQQEGASANKKKKRVHA